MLAIFLYASIEKLNTKYGRVLRSCSFRFLDQNENQALPSSEFFYKHQAFLFLFIWNLDITMNFYFVSSNSALYQRCFYQQFHDVLFNSDIVYVITALDWCFSRTQNTTETVEIISQIISGYMYFWYCSSRSAIILDFILILCSFFIFHFGTARGCGSSSVAMLKFKKR